MPPWGNNFTKQRLCSEKIENEFLMQDQLMTVEERQKCAAEYFLHEQMLRNLTGTRKQKGNQSCFGSSVTILLNTKQ